MKTGHFLLPVGKVGPCTVTVTFWEVVWDVGRRCRWSTTDEPRDSMKLPITETRLGVYYVFYLFFIITHLGDSKLSIVNDIVLDRTRLTPSHVLYNIFCTSFTLLHTSSFYLLSSDLHFFTEMIHSHHPDGTKSFTDRLHNWYLTFTVSLLSTPYGDT